jgi:predicted nucleic acid-binding Zn ribbon protein
MSYKCEQCGDDTDLMLTFTAHKICGKCTRKNHRKAVK